MSGQIVTLSSGQSYTSMAADTILAGPGSETIYDESKSVPVIVFGGTAGLTFAAADEDSSLTITSVGTGATTIAAGGADSVWAGNRNLYVTQPTGASHAGFVIDGTFVFDAGSSTSTLVAAAVPGGQPAFGGGYDAAGDAFVEDKGVLNLAGGSSNVTLVAGAGSNTINGAAATGQGLFLASGGNTSLIGGTGNDFFVVGTGADTIAAGLAANAIVVVNGAAGGSDVVQNWSANDQIYLFGYGSSGVASQQRVGGSLQLTLTDQTSITLAGVASISSAQLHFG